MRFLSELSLVKYEVIGRVMLTVLILYSSGMELHRAGVNESPVMNLFGVMMIAYALIPLFWFIKFGGEQNEVPGTERSCTCQSRI